MCGRYRRTTSEEELARRYHIPIPPQRDLPISWNIAPTQDVLTIRLHPETKQRTLDTLRWGLIPNWAKDPKVAYKTINARAETVDTAPSFRQAFKKRRCLVPVDGFYEWKKVPGGKIPYSNRHEGRFSFRVRRVMGRMERSGQRRMAAHLHDNHWRTKRVCAGDSHPDAGHPTERASRCLVIG